MKIRIATLAVAMVALTGCSSPPGPEPATPAPALPEDAIAYDDLLSTDRPFPFTNTCEQITRETLEDIGARRASDLPGFDGPAGCAVEFKTPELDMVWIEEQPPPNPSEPRYFPLVWNGDTGGVTYHRRLLLDSRYYAVETIDFRGELPGCYLTIDTGSPLALQFRGIIPEDVAPRYGELNYVVTDYEVDRAGTDRFMADHCPTVEQIAIALLTDIDPGGGSLAQE